MLKSTCTMLENQVEELEIINEDYEEKQLQWNVKRYHCLYFLQGSLSEYIFASSSR